MNHQAMAQTTPIAPVTTKAPRQPTIAIKAVTSGKDKAEPAVDPLLKMEQAMPRSLRGNQLKAVLVKDGRLAASPAPSISRAPMNCQTPRAAPVAMVKSDHQVTAKARLMRTPNLSMNQPAGSCISA